VGDQIETAGWRFEIVGLNGRRIDKAPATRVDGE
jgi:CBS domain containing-hemolysin-like protein